MDNRQKYEQEFVYILDPDNEEELKDPDKRMFKTCWRDPVMNNRYWFEFPPEWRTSSQRERIIGLRTFWVSKTFRRVWFDLDIRYFEDNGTETMENAFTVPIKCWLDYEKDLREIWYDLRSQVKAYIAEHKEQWEREDKPVPSVSMIQMDYLYIEKDNRVLLGNHLFANPGYEEDIFLRIRNLSDDAKAVLNCEEPETDDYHSDIIFEDLWDRHSILLKSSICNNNTSNYLGYSHKNYNPIKYFKISCSEPRFYIDLYHGHKHDIPINLPKDERESIILEIVIPDV